MGPPHESDTCEAEAVEAAEGEEGGETPAEDASTPLAPFLPSTDPYAEGYMPFAATGWVSVSIVFNILNTVVYGTLVVKLLEDLDKHNFTAYFSAVNTVTTLLSSFLLPPFGYVVDQLHTTKRNMLLTLWAGQALTIIFLVTDFVPGRTGQTILVLFLYLVAMFFLRVAVMLNNSQLAAFHPTRRSALSLVANFLGFGTALLGLYSSTVLQRHVPDHVGGIRLKVILIAGFGLIASLISLIAFRSPRDLQRTSFDAEGIPTPTKSAAALTRMSLMRSLATLRDLRTLPQYRSVGLFLLAYFLFSTGGTVFTIFIAAFFSKIYDISLHKTLNLQIYYYSSMVCGVVFGILHRKLASRRTSKVDTPALLIQNVLFCVCFVLCYLAVRLDWGYTATVLVALAIGFLYAWNTSIARSIMSQLSPSDKRVELMGLYSTFTYLGIAVCTLVLTVLQKGCNIGIDVLPVLLLGMVLVSFPFLHEMRAYADL